MTVCIIIFYVMVHIRLRTLQSVSTPYKGNVKIITPSQLRGFYSLPPRFELTVHFWVRYKVYFPILMNNYIHAAHFATMF